MERNTLDSRRVAAVKSCQKIFTLPGHEHGKRLYSWQNSCGSLLASSVEGMRKVSILNRQGSFQFHIPIPGNCTSMAWDEEGDVLAIVTEGSGVILFWDCHSQKLAEIDSQIKDPCVCIAWSKVGKVFAYCTSRGNLIIYNHKTMSKVPILGKHNKGINCCAWSASKCLVLGTANNQLSINTIEGDAMKTIQLQGKPRDIKFGRLKDNGLPGPVDNTTSLIVGDHTLYLLRLAEDPDSMPVELSFQQKYGKLVTHNWHGDGYIWVSFSHGFVTMVSTHEMEMGTELLLIKLESQALLWTALSDCTSQICICSGESFVELRNTKNPYSISAVAEAELEDRHDSPVSCEFSDDGQLLAVLGSEGDLTIFLTSVPLLGSSSDRSCCHMRSLTEFGLYALVDESQKLEYVYCLDTGSEPALIAMGPNHVAVVFDCQVNFYSSYDAITSTNSKIKKMPVTIKQYSSNVLALCLNSEYAATLSGHKIILHRIEGDSDDACQAQVIEEYEYENGGDRIICICMTKDFVGYGTNAGIVKLYHIQTGEIVNKVAVNPEVEPKIKSIHPDLTGCKYIITDRDGCGYLFDVRDESLIQISSFPIRVDVVLWDRDDSSSDIFITNTRGTPTVDVFVVEKNIMVGQTVHHVETVRTFSSVDSVPLLFLDGIIYGQSSSGKLGTSVNLYRDRPDLSKSCNRLGDNVAWLMGLRKFEEAYNLCDVSNISVDGWLELAKSCAINFNLEYAVKSYVRGGDYSRAYNLSELGDKNDVKLVAGHIALILGDHDLAEKCYLNSSESICALYMRCDLHQWDDALNLAYNYNPEMCSSVCLRYAEDEEESNNCLHALALYEQAREFSVAFGEADSVEKANCGIARNALRSGHMQRGLQIIAESKTHSLRLTCAEILENTKFFFEAAALYEQAEEYDRAASLFIRNKQWDKVSALLPKITSNKIHLQYAKMKETEGNYVDAARIYENSEDLLNACRLFLKAGEVNEAMEIAKYSHYPEVGQMIANHFNENNDASSAISFLLRCEYFEEAKKLAFKNDKHELFAQLVSEYLENEAPGGLMSLVLVDCVTQVGTYFESLKDYYRAGKFHFLAGNSDKAYWILKRAASNGLVANEDEFISLLTDVVLALRKLENSEETCRELVEYLIGEKDGYPKDLKHLLRFYSLGKYEVEATKACLVYSAEELSCGNVDNAQRAFLQVCKNLRTGQVRRIPAPLYKGIQMVHFLRIAKLHSTLQNVEMAARLYKRVLEDFSDFPHQAIGILTSTVVDSWKSGLQATALAACFIVMKPEYRPKLAPEFLEKFMFMLRKYGKDETKDVDDLLSPCPNCEAPLPNFDLYCKKCHTEIPYCIMSGRHLVNQDFAYCPHCEFPGIRSEFINLLKIMGNTKEDVKCTMCEMPLTVRDLDEENDYGIEDYLGYNWIGPTYEKPASTTEEKKG